MKTVMKNLQHQKTYRGRVFSGPEVSLMPVRENLHLYQKKAGIWFFPRTLNVRLDADFEIPKSGIHINEDEIKTTEYKTGITLVPATFRAEKIFLMCPDYLAHKSSVIEIMASFDIRKKFNLHNDDQIEFEVEIEQKVKKKDLTVKLNWIKCQSGNWCRLLSLNLDHAQFDNLEGVYIIWQSGFKPINKRIVQVGQGKIKERLKEYREDLAMLKYQEFGLYVTWAKVDLQYQDGIERYLADELNPKIRSRYREVSPIEVNLPWD